jgi:DNA-binding MarR family transcriptional regulator
LSSEYVEPPAVRDGAPAHRDLVFTVLDLGADIDAVGRAAASLIGINQTDLICLNALFREGPMTAGQLATVIGLTSGATTTAIDRLERAGYAHRRSDPADRRRVMVETSPEGAQRAFAVFDGLLEELARLSAAYPPDQLTLLLELLGRVRTVILGYATTLREQAATQTRGDVTHETQS